jgi:hypothetical protein
MERVVEERSRLRGRVAAVFYLLNIISGSLALVFISRKNALSAGAANLTATISYVIVTVVFYFIFKPANRRVSLLAAIFSLMGCAVGAINSFRLASVPVNALVFFGVYCLLIGYLISKSTFLPRVFSILMIIGGLGWLTFLSRSLANAMAPYNMAPGILAETLADPLAPDSGHQRAAMERAGFGRGLDSSITSDGASLAGKCQMAKTPLSFGGFFHSFSTALKRRAVAADHGAVARFVLVRNRRSAIFWSLAE